jgi:ABC-2 type transport system permease protein
VIAALVLHGFRAQRRSAQWWTLGIVVLAVLNAAFWPTLDGTDALADLERSLSPELQKAFGAQNLGTEAGYLDGQVFALLLPALLSGVAIAGATALTSGDEGGGRLELLHALPVSRQALWSSRFGSVLLVLAGVTAVVAAVVVASLYAFSLSEAGLGPVLAATVACAVLAAFHAAVSYAAGGFGLARGTAVGIGILVLLAGYVVNFLFPLSETLSDARRLSPWSWAVGDQPVTNGVSLWSNLLLAAVTAGLVALGTLAVGRRDLRGA